VSMSILMPFQNRPLEPTRKGPGFLGLFSVKSTNSGGGSADRRLTGRARNNRPRPWQLTRETIGSARKKRSAAAVHAHPPDHRPDRAATATYKEYGCDHRDLRSA